MKLTYKILLFALGILSFALIRFFEKELFYDPLISFYKNTFHQDTFPELDVILYSLNLAFRYWLNTLISLALIWVVFQDKNYIRFSIILFAVLFILGIISFWFIAENIEPQSYMTLFYIRRFLIQPLLVIILLPAFYFQNINKNADA